MFFKEGMHVGQIEAEINPQYDGYPNLSIFYFLCHFFSPLLTIPTLS